MHILQPLLKQKRHRQLREDLFARSIAASKARFDCDLSITEYYSNADTDTDSGAERQNQLTANTSAASNADHRGLILANALGPALSVRGQARLPLVPRLPLPSGLPGRLLDRRHSSHRGPAFGGRGSSVDERLGLEPEGPATSQRDPNGNRS